MNIQAHIVTEAMRHEKTGDSAGNHFVDVSLHKSQVAEALKHVTDGGKVHFTIGDARTCKAESQLIAAFYYVIYIFLLRSEFSGTRIGPGKVGSIMSVAFRSGIDNKQPARSDDLMMGVVVEGFPVLGKNGGK